MQHKELLQSKSASFSYNKPRHRAAFSPSSNNSPALVGGKVTVQATGCLWWRTLIVPPNMWVVHLRQGYQKPLHLGVGLSFRYNAMTDTYLVAPAALQTLLISARCICKERQGILISAYVQYCIDDFSVAYCKLDLSNRDDPMYIVNMQLREQCEASIKDKVATLSIDDVLADKRPIVEELTSRLAGVSGGHGLKIIQVQIKEAIISSAKLWDTLQMPFREEQARIGRLAQLERERLVSYREMNNDAEAEKARAQTKLESDVLKRQREVELARSNAELEEIRVKAELAQIEAQRKLDAARGSARIEAVKQEIELLKLQHDAKLARERDALGVEEERKRLENLVEPRRLDELLIRTLPDIVSHIHPPNQPTHSIRISSTTADNDDPLSTVAKTVQLAKNMLSSNDSNLRLVNT